MPSSDIRPRRAGVGLALSGGGFRATLFHLGSLTRLNELGWLPKLSEVTSVSGGSIVAGFLGYRWRDLTFDARGVATNFQDVVVAPLQEFCAATIDVGTIIGGILSPFRHPSVLLRNKYDEKLFNGATLQDLPADDDGPRFTIYATNLQTGASVRFSKPYLAEYRLGLVDNPTVPLAVAVAASSAFPPPLCPVTLEFAPEAWRKVEGADLYENVDLRTTLLVGDGGIYDNLGLERIWDLYTTVLVSDAGAPFTVQDGTGGLRFSQVMRTKRALDIIAAQARSLRKRQLIGDYIDKVMGGAYWSIATEIAGYDLAAAGQPGPVVQDSPATGQLGSMRTRLNKFSEEEQGHLINWGYALGDAAMRRYVIAEPVPAGVQPIPAFPL